MDLPYRVEDRQTGERGTVHDLTSENRPIVDWDNGRKTSRSIEDLIVNPIES